MTENSQSFSPHSPDRQERARFLQLAGDQVIKLEQGIRMLTHTPLDPQLPRLLAETTALIVEAAPPLNLGIGLQMAERLQGLFLRMEAGSYSATLAEESLLQHWLLQILAILTQLLEAFAKQEESFEKMAESLWQEAVPIFEQAESYLQLDPEMGYSEAQPPMDSVNAEAVESTVSSPTGSRGLLLGHDRGLTLGATLIFAVGLLMRLWQLNQYAAPVFDEVYFPEFAKKYLDGVSFYDVHPPLGKYLIVLGIYAFGRNEIGYRLLTALFGALIPVLVAGVMYRLTYQRNLALLAGGLLLTDGLFLVESRYGLMNVFLVAFGMAAQIFLLTGLEQRGWRRTLLFSLSGVMLGSATAVKWNGLWFCIMFAGLGVLVWTVVLAKPQWIPRLGVLGEIRQMRWWHYAFCFMAVPLLVYYIQWIPHIQLNPQKDITIRPGLISVVDYTRSVMEVNKALLSGQTAGNLIVDENQSVHPYCSSSLRSLGSAFPALKPYLNNRLASAGAWSWPVMARPVGYYFDGSNNIWRGVTAIGNPLLWWMSTASILILAVRGLRQFQMVGAYLLIGYAANYLPWFIVSRCVFIYHYMSALAFSVMALALLVYEMVHHPDRIEKATGLTVVTSVLLAQLFFMPIWYGIPLTPGQFYQRMWFRANPMPIFCFSEEQCQKTPLRIPAIPGFNWI
ncbi:MAG: phospholipid carrier-dependent glycosyltransferase [Cyanobacteriota bacterium]|nr:phospholipid carrier-dependent glycosyltransferase [Cyanobacteriota bacterium]